MPHSLPRAKIPPAPWLQAYGVPGLEFLISILRPPNPPWWSAQTYLEERVATICVVSSFSSFAISVHHSKLILSRPPWCFVPCIRNQISATLACFMLLPIDMRMAWLGAKRLPYVHLFRHYYSYQYVRLSSQQCRR